jgi:hypothetical protein
MAGHLSDGTIDGEVAREWVRTNIRPHVTDAGAGGAIGAGVAVDDIDDDTDAVDDITHERARLTRLKADMAQIELDRLRGGTEEEQKLNLIETAIFAVGSRIKSSGQRKSATFFRPRSTTALYW